MQNVITLFLGLIISFSAFGQISFYKTYTNNGYDFGQGIVQLEDSSYLITGSSSSFDTPSAQAFLLKIDSLGNHIWSKDYGGTESDWGRRVLYQKNFGCFIAGYSNSFGTGNYDAYLVKTDENGVLEWEKNYGTTGLEKIHDAILLADTGVVMVGETNSNLGDKNIYMVRTDKFGDTLWTKNIPNTGEDLAKCVESYDDTTLYVVGKQYDFTDERHKGFVLKMNSNSGEIYWTNLYGSIGNNSFNGFIIDTDELKVIGERIHDNDAVFGSNTRIDLDGNFIHEQASGASDFSYELVTKYGDLGNLYIGYHFWNNEFSYPTGKDLSIYQFNSQMYWQNSGMNLSATGEDRGGELISTNDGGAIIVGYNTSFGMGGNNILVCKIGPGDTYPSTDSPAEVYNLLELNDSKELDKKCIVYPNPALSYLSISTTEYTVNYELYTLTGCVIQSGELSGENKSIDLQNIEAGNYFMRIITENGIETFKIVVNK